MWKAEGGKLVGASSLFFPLHAPTDWEFDTIVVGFVGETATFIAESAEDENDSVVREAHELKNAVESVAGSISGL